jgi:pyrroline-5-carboxylate reductase
MSNLRDALIDQGFTREEAIELIKATAAGSVQIGSRE